MDTLGKPTESNQFKAKAKEYLDFSHLFGLGCPKVGGCGAGAGVGGGVWVGVSGKPKLLITQVVHEVNFHCSSWKTAALSAKYTFAALAGKLQLLNTKVDRKFQARK